MRKSQSANQNYRSIFEGSVDGIFRTDVDGHYLEANPALAKIYKYESVEAFLSSVSLAKSIYVDETRRDAFREQIASVGVIRNFEAEVRCADGTTTWINENARTIRDAEGHVLYYEGIVRDISAQREAQTVLERAMRDAEAANRAKSEFLANMSHEIRTPMNAILGFAELLKGLVHEPRPKSYLQAVTSSGQTLLALINDILDLSKIEAGKLGLDYAAVDLAVVFRDIHHIFSQKAEQKGVDLILDLPLDFPPALLLDEVRVRQILFNLVGNALKFTEHGRVELVARIDSGSVGDEVDLVIEVNDTGVGISAEEHGKIFEAFSQQRGQDAKKYGGTGLGLTITRRLVEMMRGRISLESEVGKGSTFRCHFPKVQRLAAPTRKTSLPADRTYELTDLEPCTVLVADDMLLNRDLLRAFFFETGHRFLEAGNGLEAIEIARAERPAVILMDVRMPVMDGLEATRALKADPLLKSIPVIIVTASAMQSEEAELQTICDAFLRKPVSRHEVAGQMGRFLPLRSKQSENRLTPSETVPMGAVENSKIDELISIVEAEVARWQNLTKAPLISGVEAFGQDLAKLGRNFGCGSLEAYGNGLAQCASTFDVVAMEKFLFEFKDILADLRQNGSTPS